MTDRKALYINLNEAVTQKLDAIAAFIIALAPKHPLFPQPLRPSRLVDIEAGKYNLLELSECCVRLLAQHITQEIVSDETLKDLAKEADILRDLPLQSMPGNILPTHMADLMVIYHHLNSIGDIAYSTRRGSINLKFPLMVAILYAYQVVEQEG